ncbi:hypothetical protein [Marinomonas ostreistagni]|uniref:Uncharacterized protein n=1 Tax=Marinomonas ostreistagni TaxID=359209 RepID=A0ABS0ZF48_9GAMM|nr:hypothetical protein [Marinomonas ostreistagni]MBJ7552018.1 hypothetical protein [Marinomonas ostreistagni]
MNQTNTQPTPPKKWKIMLIVWLSIYPLLNIFFPIFDVIFPYISEALNVESLTLPIRLLIMTIVIVPIMSTIMGKLQGHLFHWLRR